MVTAPFLHGEGLVPWTGASLTDANGHVSPVRSSSTHRLEDRTPLGSAGAPATRPRCAVTHRMAPADAGDASKRPRATVLDVCRETLADAVGDVARADGAVRVVVRSRSFTTNLLLLAGRLRTYSVSSGQQEPRRRCRSEPQVLPGRFTWTRLVRLIEEERASAPSGVPERRRSWGETERRSAVVGLRPGNERFARHPRPHAAGFTGNVDSDHCNVRRCRSWACSLSHPRGHATARVDMTSARTLSEHIAVSRESSPSARSHRFELRFRRFTGNTRRTKPARTHRALPPCCGRRRCAAEGDGRKGRPARAVTSRSGRFAAHVSRETWRSFARESHPWVHSPESRHQWRSSRPMPHARR